jgi:hypothetical protein
MLSLLVVTQVISVAEPILSEKDARTLVMNTPEVLAADRRHRCPEAELSWKEPKRMSFQVRSRCIRSGSGLIGNYVVDLGSGRIWSDIEQKTLVDSQHLEKLRKLLLDQLQKNK